MEGKRDIEIIIHFCIKENDEKFSMRVCSGKDDERECVSVWEKKFICSVDGWTDAVASKTVQTKKQQTQQYAAANFVSMYRKCPFMFLNVFKWLRSNEKMNRRWTKQNR